MDEEAEDRFTELARARLADTLSEAARMLTAAPGQSGQPGDPGDPGGRGTHAPDGERAGGRGFDDVLLGRGGRATLGLAPAPAEEPAALSGPTATGPPIRLEPAVADGAVAEVGELRRQVAELRGRVEHLQSELRTAVARLASVPVATRAPATEPAPPAEPSRPVVGRVSHSTPSLTDPAPPAASPRPAAAGAEPSPAGSASEPPAAGAPPGPPAPALPADGYTWAFTQTPRRRFWRRR